MVLEEKDLWGIVSGDEREPVGTSITKPQEEWYKKRRRALATICLSLVDNQLSLVRSSQNAQEAWNRLENHYQVKSLANKLFLRKRYFSMTMDESDNMMQHTNKMNALAEQLDSEEHR